MRRRLTQLRHDDDAMRGVGVGVGVCMRMSGGLRDGWEQQDELCLDDESDGVPDRSADSVPDWLSDHAHSVPDCVPDEVSHTSHPVPHCSPDQLPFARLPALVRRDGDVDEVQFERRPALHTLRRHPS